jgi:hypothetical protein
MSKAAAYVAALLMFFFLCVVVGVAAVVFAYGLGAIVGVFIMGVRLVIG